ncbi:unnamed protein product, partial [Mesorhabditis belari]|uniref:protein-tyrosine-phosphatase n=1 Tax=Mesorhabditis belari TaxID=2138241 RepID=A0AAF3FN88_9BILA
MPGNLLHLRLPLQDQTNKVRPTQTRKAEIPVSRLTVTEPPKLLDGYQELTPSIFEESFTTTPKRRGNKTVKQATRVPQLRSCSSAPILEKDASDDSPQTVFLFDDADALSALNESRKRFLETPDGQIKNKDGFCQETDWSDSPNSVVISGCTPDKRRRLHISASTGQLDTEVAGNFDCLVEEREVEYTLPVVPDSECKAKSSAFKYISQDTLVSELEQLGDQFEQKYILVDCRYNYEYEGGHIKFAHNSNETSLVTSIFFSDDPVIFGNRRARIPIFYCEFSEVRGPRMANELRRIDRALNLERYPFVEYKQIFVLHGGYRGFYGQEHEHVMKTRKFCTPMSYVPMNHPEHVNKLRELSAHRKRLDKGRRQGRVHPKVRTQERLLIQGPVFDADEIEDRH